MDFWVKVKKIISHAEWNHSALTSAHKKIKTNSAKYQKYSLLLWEGTDLELPA